MRMHSKDKMTHLSTWKQRLLLQCLTFLQNKIYMHYYVCLE